MSEKELIYEELKQIEDTISHVIERTKNIRKVFNKSFIFT